VLRYIINRIGMLILMLLVVVFTAFTILYVLPGSNLQILSPLAQGTALGSVLETLHLSGTFFGNFILFVVNCLIRFDVKAIMSPGSTVFKNLPVRIGYTMTLCLGAVLLSWIIGLPLGITAAAHKGSKLDNLITILTVGFGSMPAFWVGLMMLLVFCWMLGLVNILFSGYESLVLPILTLTISNIPIVTGAARSGVVETLDKDFILTVRAKGVKERRVVWAHAVRNTLLPLLSILSSQLTKAFGGALIIETVFAIPGLGRLMFDSITSRDNVTVMVCLLISAAISGVVSMVADIVYTAVNPSVRQRYEK